MLNGFTITVVIPTLNEAEGIAETINTVPACVDEIIVVDGASTDGTPEIARKTSPKVKVVNEPRKGYGRAFKTGFENAKSDIIATTDGDGTYPIERLENIVKELKEKNLDFISCSRFPLDNQSSMRKRNWFGNHMITLAASTLWLHRFDDILSGMWVFKRSCLHKLNLQSNSRNFSEEIKLEAFSKLKTQFTEIHIPYRERLGQTKLVPWKVGIQNLCYMAAMRVGAVQPAKKLLQRENNIFRL